MTGVLALKLTIWSALFVGTASAWARSPRIPWLMAASLLTAHALLAFGTVHGWSHAAASAATERQVREVTGFGFGGGLWANYVFLAGAWVAGLRWAALSHGMRTAWWGAWLFMGINGAVVFVDGPARLLGIAWCVASAASLARHLRAGRRAVAVSP